MKVQTISHAMRLALICVLGLVLVAVVTVAGPNAAAAQDISVTCTDETVPGELLVGYRDGAVAAATSPVNGASLLDVIPEINVQVVQLPVSIDTAEATAVYETDPNVEFVEPNSVVCATTTPNDQYFPNQWGLNNTGQSNGTAGADIAATDAWNVTTGSASVTIAVIDTGIDYTHPDLDDGRYVGGYDFINNDGDPFDDNGHGTHVAGIATADTNDNGVAGIAWNSKFMGIKVLGATGSGSWASVANGVVYAANNDADVMNLSLGSTGYSQTLANAMAYAHSKGVVGICSAGNTGQHTTTYPAALDQHCLAVAATNRNDQRASFSTMGPFVDVAAPGVTVLSAYPAGGYRYLSGTSMAAPHAAGVAALVLSVEPNLSVDQVFDRLRATADDVNGGGVDSQLGFGRINAAAAVGATSLTCFGEPVTIVGTLGADTITGTAGDDVIHALGGDDQVYGAGGSDLICGGDGDDRLNGAGGTGADGADRIAGEAGDDAIWGGNGNDELWGGPGADILLGQNHDDTIMGQEDDDRIAGGWGADTIWGGDGADSINGEAHNDKLYGQDGDDVILGGAGLDEIWGGLGNDQLIGQNHDDTIGGNEGDDVISGGHGNDLLSGMDGNDTIRGNLGNDEIHGDAGNDLLGGNDGEDRIIGGAGNDRVWGGADRDLVWGGNGDDVLWGGLGDDALAGQNGDDVLHGQDGNDWTGGGNGTDACDGEVKRNCE